MEWTIPRSLWKDQELFDEATNTCPIGTRKAIVVVSYHYDIVMGVILAQHLEDTRKQNAIYYISKKMFPFEEKYSPLEKTCVALVWATCKLRHYMLAYKVLLIARMDPLKYLMEKPMQDGKTAKWVFLLLEFDIKYVT